MYSSFREHQNAGKKLSGISISSGSQLYQYGIGITASGSVCYRKSRISLALASFGNGCTLHVSTASGRKIERNTNLHGYLQVLYWVYDVDVGV